MDNCPECLMLKEVNISLDNPSYCRACYQRERAENKRLREIAQVAVASYHDWQNDVMTTPVLFRDAMSQLEQALEQK